MAKRVTYGLDAIRDLVTGINSLVAPVAVTLGPCGRYVVLEHMSKLTPVITKDGVTIVKSMSLKRPTEELGVKLLKQVAGSVSEQVGDGTTTAVVLAREIVIEAMKAVITGANPEGVRRGMADFGSEAIQLLVEMARPCEDILSIAHIASVAANGDKSVGEIFAKAWHAVGKAGVIQVELGNSIEDVLNIVLGTEYEQGYLSAQFVTDKERQVTEFDNPLILMYDRSIEAFSELLPVLEIAKSESRPLVIMADDVVGEALEGLILNHVSDTQKVVVLKPPLFGETRLSALTDMAILTGGKAVFEIEGDLLSKVDRSYLGEAERIYVTSETTLITNPLGDKEKIQERINYLQSEIAMGDLGSKSPTGRADFIEKLEERIELLCGAVATIEVGGATEIEIRARKVLIENASNAIQAATEFGVLPGGGSALVRVRQMLKELHSADPSVELGIHAVREAMEVPMRQILINGGLRPDTVISRIESSTEPFYGFDLSKQQYGDLYEMGVIDPFKVTATVLQYGIAIATAVLNSAALVTEGDEERMFLGDVELHEGFNAKLAGEERINDFRNAGYFDD